MVTGDDWIKSALSDDSAVAELLLLINRSGAEAAAPSGSGSGSGPGRLDWSVGQPRRSTKGADAPPPPPATKKGEEEAVCSRRASPTTPLSWSETTSSGGGGGFEESSLSAAKLRSKASSSAAGPSIKTASSSKRLRRKKTLAELQVEETSMRKEQRNLQHELTNLRAVIERHGALNERLKKLKLDYVLQERQQALEYCSRASDTEKPTTSTSRETVVFELPDLNLPVEDS